MGRTVFIQGIMCLEYILLAVGMYVYVFGINNSIHRVRALHNRGKYGRIALHFVIVSVMALTGIPPLPVMFILYAAVTLYIRHSGDEIQTVILRGIQNFTVLTSCQLLLYTVVYRNWPAEFSERITGTVGRVEQAMILVWLLMAQLLLIMIHEVRYIKKEKLRCLHYAAALKNTIEMFWFYLLLPVPDTGYRELAVIAAYVGTICLDYYILREVEVIRILCHQETRKVIIPLNREEYYTKMEEEHLQIRRLFHDMKNQLMILEGEKDQQSEYMKSFIRQSEKQISSIDCFYHTGNAELDMLLFQSKNRAEANGIEFDVVFQEGCLDFMEQEDLNTIFVNAVLNAIEACMKMTEGKRRIRIQAGAKLNDVIVSFRNTVDPKLQSSHLFTTKQDRKHHGLGIQSIQRTADKYKGFVSVTEEQEYFQLVILFVKEQI